jgi:hypothetical protein
MADQAFVMWGVQSRYYSPATTAKLFLEAEDLTPLGTAALSTALNSTASGAGASKTVFAGDLTTTYAAILSTQASGGGAHLSHVGDFRVWARVQCPTANTGSVRLRLEWGSGDLRRFTQNDEWEMQSTWEGSWRLVDLGLVHLTKARAGGAQRWEGRVLAKSTVAGDDIHVDCLFVMPVTEGYGEARALPTQPAPTSFLLRDEFDQTAGALDTKTLPTGQTWASTGAAPDFSIASGITTRTTAASDRHAVAGASYVNTLVQADVMTSAGGALRLGVIARWVNSSTYFRVYATPGSGASVIASPFGTGEPIVHGAVIFTPGNWYTLRVAVFDTGRVVVWFFPRGSRPGPPALSAEFASLATGGALQTGSTGLYDFSSIAATRSFDNFGVSVPVKDAVIFAGQSMETRHDGVYRESADGSTMDVVSRYEGSTFLLPPSGSEGRATRIIVKPSRGDPDSDPDSALDDISVRISYTPRYLHVPEA